MSENLQNNQDEVDLGQLFNAIGRVFDRFINFIASIFKGIFSIIIYSIKAVIVNFKIIVIVVIISGIIGYALEKIKPNVYSSEMLVRTYFDAKYQLATNISYYNALLIDEDYNALSNIFTSPKDTLQKLVEFEIYPGPETENDRIVEYNEFIKSIDSVRAQELSFDDFIENRDIFSGSLFILKVYSTKKDIFKDLEKGIDSSFNNRYSKKKKQKRDDIIDIQKENISSSIAQLDSLQSVYVEVLKKESEKPSASIGSGDGFPLQQEKSVTKEYELITKEIKLRERLRALDEQKVEESVYFDVISSFQEIGNIETKLTEKYSIVFPILGFLLLCLLYLASKIIKFAKNYEE